MSLNFTQMSLAVVFGIPCCLSYLW